MLGPFFLICQLLNMIFFPMSLSERRWISVMFQPPDLHCCFFNSWIPHCVDNLKMWTLSLANASFTFERGSWNSLPWQNLQVKPSKFSDIIKIFCQNRKKPNSVKQQTISMNWSQAGIWTWAHWTLAHKKKQFRKEELPHKSTWSLLPSSASASRAVWHLIPLLSF